MLSDWRPRFSSQLSGIQSSPCSLRVPAAVGKSLNVDTSCHLFWAVFFEIKRVPVSQGCYNFVTSWKNAHEGGTSLWNGVEKSHLRGWLLSPMVECLPGIRKTGSILSTEHKGKQRLCPERSTPAASPATSWKATGILKTTIAINH